MILDHETQKLNELDGSYETEMKDWKLNLRHRKQVRHFMLRRYFVIRVHYKCIINYFILNLCLAKLIPHFMLRW